MARTRTPSARTATLRAIRGADEATLARVARLLAAEPTAAVSDPETAAEILWPLLAGREREAVAVAALDRRNRVIEVVVISEGSDAFCVVCPRTVLRWVLTRARPAAGFILAHNHPSGDPTPSAQDREVTTRVARAGAAVGLPLLDHLVLTDDRHAWRSFAADGAIERPSHRDMAPTYTT